jgi:hypothetical protein
LNIISSQPYTKTIRKIKENKLFYIEEHYTLTLYEEKLITAFQHFSLENIYDISYKPLSSKYGFLYLHTHKGCFSFQVKSDPSHFIEAFKTLK